LNIGIVTTWFERGAAYVSRQYRDILQTKHNVFIYARGGETYAKDNPIWNNVWVTWDKKSIFRSMHVVNMVDFQKWIESNNIELVFFNEQYQWEPVLLCNKLGVKTGAYIDYYTKEIVPLFKCYDFLICNTKRHYSVFSWHPQVFYIPWGTNVNVFKPTAFSVINSNCITFFHSAGFSPKRKGTDLVLRAVARIQGNAHFVIHSQKKLKKCFPKLKDTIQDLEDKGLLTCYEKTIHAPGLYHLGDVYVYPSRLEGIGLTIAEALGCGLPVITSDYPPMNEFIDNTNGSLVKISKLSMREDNYYWPQCSVGMDNLYRCMQKYIEQRNQIIKLKKAARAYAEKYLDWSKNAQELPTLFNNVVKYPSKDKSDIEQQARIFDKKMYSLQKRLLRFFKRKVNRFTKS